MKKPPLFALATLLLAILLPACQGNATTSSPEKGLVTVGSKIDTEGSLLAQMIILMLHDRGFSVVDRSQFGPTQVVRAALLSSDIDMYPEYTGNGQLFFSDTDPGIWKNAQQGYDTVKGLDKDRNNVIWLKPAPANNTWAIATTREMADRENLSTLEDFAVYVNRGGRVRLAASEEFVTSKAALPAFQEAYDFTLRQDQLLTFAGGNTAQTEKAAAEGTDGVNFAMAYGTDGALGALGLVVLSDPRGAQPVYQPAPTVRGAVYQEYPEMSGILEPVFASLDLQTLQSLNARIALEGRDAAEVAESYLASRGFLK